jgi:hypothetical protein
VLGDHAFNHRRSRFAATGGSKTIGHQCLRQPRFLITGVRLILDRSLSSVEAPFFDADYRGQDSM